MVVGGFPKLEGAGRCAEAICVPGCPRLVRSSTSTRSMLEALDQFAPGVLPIDVEAALLIEVEALSEGIDRSIAVAVR